jgi:hypothetical protein
MSRSPTTTRIGMTAPRALPKKVQLQPLPRPNLGFSLLANEYSLATALKFHRRNVRAITNAWPNDQAVPHHDRDTVNF